MDKKFSEENYISSVDSTAPDKDLLWERISAGISEDGHSDITPFVSAYDDMGKKRPAISAGRVIKLAAAAAAVAAVCISVPFITSDSLETSSSDSAAPNYAADEAPAFDMALNEAAAAPSENVIRSVTGWDYSSDLSAEGTVLYETLDLTATDSGIYTALSSNNEEDYFVEAAVLSETEFFLDAKVTSAYILEDENTAMYELEIVRVVSDNEITMPETITVESDSPYELRNGREYLLPMKYSCGSYEIVFDNAPQIEFTNSRELVAHNGWSSLSESGEHAELIYPNVYDGDFFYDRMNLYAECSLENLFEQWTAAKQK